jgi:peptidoglycan/LPS O-acetylase OafA/YrhL
VRSLLRGEQAPPVGRYAVRRATRILPAYWIALGGALILVTGSRLVHWWELPLHALLGQDVVPDEPNKFLFVAWTLSVEVMFYVFVPIAAWAAYRIRGPRAIGVSALAKCVIGIWIFSVAWRVGVSFIDTPSKLAAHQVPAGLAALRWVLPAFLYAFAPGILIYLAETREASECGGSWAVYRRARQHPFALVLGAVVLLFVVAEITQQGGRWGDLGVALVSLPAALALTAVLGLRRVARPLAATFGPVGLISYGIYLWHAVVRDALLKHGIDVVPGSGVHAWPAAVFVLLLATLPLAALSWLLVERPFLRSTTNWDKRRRRLDDDGLRAPAATALAGSTAHT